MSLFEREYQISSWKPLSSIADHKPVCPVTTTCINFDTFRIFPDFPCLS